MLREDAAKPRSEGGSDRIGVSACRQVNLMGASRRCAVFACTEWLGRV